MLYITIILVASGLFLIIYSLLTSSATKKHRPAVSSAPSQIRGYIQTRGKEPQPIEDFTAVNTHKNSKIESEFDTKTLNFEFLEDNKTTAEEPEDKDWNVPEPDNIIDSVKETVKTRIEDKIDENPEERFSSDRPETDSYPAILYEDSSNIFDYENRSSIIDSTLKEYEKIKRIGKGMLEIKENSISFTIENKNYRFDFHRIAKIIGGNNYISVLMKKSKNARLFIFDKETSIGIKIERLFKDHSRGAA